MNKYHIALSEIESADGTQKFIEFDFENHDDVFHIIDRLKNDKRFRNADEATRFAIGLKLFSSVMMENRGSELFKDFEPAFVDFMKKLKKH